MKKLRGLYAITPEFQDDFALFKWVETMVQNRVQFVQYRDKTHALPERLNRAKHLKTLAHHFDAQLIINDSLLLCLQTDADGVHLGQNDGSLFLARQLLGKDKILGASCYASLKTAQIAQHLGADYVAFGSVFHSPTKPQAPGVALSKIALAKMALSIPVGAIGGITPDNAPAVLKSGMDFLAISSALTHNSQKVIQQLNALLN